MPYANIHYVKVELRLLNDPRFFTMSDQAQLIYVKLIILCASLNNKVPRKYELLKEHLRTKHSEDELGKLMEEVKSHFPKVLAHKEFYYIKDLGGYLHWVAPRNSQGTPKEPPQPQEHLITIRNHYIKLKGWDIKNLVRSDFARITKASSLLFERSGRNLDLAMESLLWGSRLNWSGWSLEYVLKNWAEFMKQKNQDVPAASREADLSHLKR